MVSVRVAAAEGVGALMTSQSGNPVLTPLLKVCHSYAVSTRRFVCGVWDCPRSSDVMLKKRVSAFDNTLRELSMTPSGICVGPPLTDLRGILSGYPEQVAKPRAGRAA